MAKTTAEHLRDALDGKWKDARDKARAGLADDLFADDPYLDYKAARARVLEQMRALTAQGWVRDGFRVENGGTGNAGAAVAGIETLVYANMSLMVKAGVQWGLFGGAIENLGTKRHHDQYIRPLIDLDLLGCFAMTESGHGSDVQELETTATYDPATQEFIINSPTPSSRKDYIGGAAEHARVAAVFAQLVTQGQGHGVHCFVVPIRDEAGADLPGVTTSDCGLKGGLLAVDNGRIMFDNVRIPRANLLDKYGAVAEDGTYSSPIDNRGKRFFTMVGTLVRGRVSVGGSAGAAARVALSIAARYALKRRQFRPEAGANETVLMDYLAHQRRLLPLIARSYALAFAQNDLIGRMDDVQSGRNTDSQAQRALEARAAGIKAATTWHATRAIQEAREACGGAGYLTENRLVTLKGDSDVFTTFEGDNHVLTQLVAKELLTAYSAELYELDTLGWVKFAANIAGDVVREKTGVRQFIQSLFDSSDETVEEGDLSRRAVQLQLFADREDHLVRTAAQRLRAGMKDGNAFAAFNNAQDHILKAGSAHIERIVLEAFIDGFRTIEDPAARAIAEDLCDLFVFAAIEEDRDWFMMHRFMSVERAKAVRRGVNELCEKLRPHTLALVEGMGVPEGLLRAAMLEDASVYDRTV